MIKDFLSKVRVRRKVIDSHAVMVAFPRCGLSRLRDLLWNFTLFIMVSRVVVLEIFSSSGNRTSRECQGYL